MSKPIALLLAVLITSTTVHAETLKPDTNFHAPRFVTPYPAARVILLSGGRFLRFSSVDTLVDQPAGPLTRYLADGTLDSSFQFTRDYSNVLAVLELPSGKLIVAAQRNEYNRVVEEIIRLNNDGSVDSSFTTTLVRTDGSDDVRALVVQPDGKILASGPFTHFGGETRPGIVRLLPDGGLDKSFAIVDMHSSSGGLGTLAEKEPILLPDGKIIIYGDIKSVNGIIYPRVARLNSDGTRDASFQPSGFTPAVPIATAHLLSDGKILLGGRFSLTTPSKTYNNLPFLRINSDGSADQTYGYFSAPSATLNTRDSALQADGKVVGLDRNKRTVYRYNQDGSLDSTFRQPAFQFPQSQTPFLVIPQRVVVATDGKVLVSGTFSDVDSAQPHEAHFGIARFNPDGTLDPSFTSTIRTGLITFPNSVAGAAGKAAYITFDAFNSLNDVVLPNNFARLKPDGSVDSSYNPFINPPAGAPLGSDFKAKSVTALADGTTFLLGSSYGKLLADGAQDPSFGSDPAIASVFGNPGDDHVFMEADGTFLLNSNSAQAVLNGQTVFHVGKDGKFDNSTTYAFGLPPSLVVTRFFDGTVDEIYADQRLLAVGADGTSYVAALSFDSETSQTHNDLYYLNANASGPGGFPLTPLSTSLDFPLVFDPYARQTLQPPDGALQAPTMIDAEVQSDGKVVFVGPFSFGGYTPLDYRGVLRINADGSFDTSFQTGQGPQWTSTTETSTVRPVVEQVESDKDGKLLITGTFEAFNGVPAPGIARLNPDGSVDTSFVAPVVRNRQYSGTSVLARQPDGSFLLSGPYSYVGESTAPTVLHLVVPVTKAGNISTRLKVDTGDAVAIGGFIIDGTTPKKVIIRAIGPSLAKYGIAGVLEDPFLNLVDNKGQVIASNDNWRATQEADIMVSGHPPEDDRESAIIMTLQPGAYTAIMSGNSGTTGVGLVEIYDLDAAADSQMGNISTRGTVLTAENVMIGGFILAGSDPTRVVVRAIGPSLTQYGVSGVLADPMLALYDANGAKFAENDDWQSTQAQELTALNKQPGDPREAAILTSLNAGAYTAIVTGKDGSTGVALVEAYVLP